MGAHCATVAYAACAGLAHLLLVGPVLRALGEGGVGGLPVDSLPRDCADIIVSSHLARSVYYRHSVMPSPKGSAATAATRIDRCALGARPTDALGDKTCAHFDRLCVALARQRERRAGACTMREPCDRSFRCAIEDH